MSEPEVHGFAITPKRVGFWLSLIALASVAASGMTIWNDRGYAIEQLEKNDISLAGAVTELKTTVKDLTTEVNELNINLALQKGALERK